MGWLQRLLGKEDRRSSAGHAARALPTPGVPSPRREHAVNVAAGVGGYAVLDVETTGLSPREHRVLDLAVVLVDDRGRLQVEWASRVNPQGPVGATHIHGLTQKDVAEAPTFDQLVPRLVELLAGRALVAHNARFDLGFLRYEFGRAGWGWPADAPALCTLDESWHFLPHLDRRRLPDCCWAAGIQLTDAHSALGDARATAMLLASYLDPTFGVPPRPEHRAVLAEAARVKWPTGPGQGRIAVPARARTEFSEAQTRRILASGGLARPLRVVTLLERFTVSDAMDNGAPTGTRSYLELLVEILEDGQVTQQEQQALRDIVELYELSDADVVAAHLGFVRALIREALDDGVLARAEKAELHTIADLLGVPQSAVKDLLDGEEQARLTALSAGLSPLPSDWVHGDPLRVGQSVGFTGCDDALRQDLENRAREVGVRVTGSVSRRTAMLVTDGSFSGTKAAAAEQLGTRVVHPDTFSVLLDHVQPAASSVPSDVPGPRSASSVKDRLSATPPPVDGPSRRPTAAVVRAWAQERGMDVGVRGRLAAEVWDAYAEAHGVVDAATG